MRIEVSESAQLPTSPVSPQVERNVLLGAVLGALLGLGYAVVRSLLDRRIRSAEDIERDTGVPVVGSVPDIGKAPGIFVGTGTGNAALAAEGVRRLRTNLSYMDVDNPPRAIVVTSPKQGDGKSTVAANLAAAIAGSGQAVTLVDADLRHPPSRPRRGSTTPWASPMCWPVDSSWPTPSSRTRPSRASACSPRARVRPTPARSWGRRPCAV